MVRKQKEKYDSSYVFADDDRKIRVKTSGSKAELDILDAASIIPALHWLEWISLDELHKTKQIGVNLVKRINEAPSHQYHAENVTLHSGGDPYGIFGSFGGIDSSSYNYVLLHPEIKHPISVVLSEFRGFLINRGISQKLRLIIKDMETDDIYQLRRAIEDKVQQNPGCYASFSDRNIGTNTAAIYASFGNGLSKAAKKRIGFRGRYSATKLSEERFELK